MTFASETVRMLYHQLPTETQVWYADWEADMAKRRRYLHIDAVMQQGNALEVVVRIAEHLQVPVVGLKNL